MFKFAVVLFILLLALSVVVIIYDSPQSPKPTIRKDREVVSNPVIKKDQRVSVSIREKANEYLPNVQNIQNKYDYNYYEAYTFAYRYASVKASIAADTYWMQFYAKHWDKYAHDKGHPNKLSQARFWQIMEHADREANK